MRGMQRPGLAAVEMLRQIVCIPQIEIADLRTLDADDSEEMTGRYAKNSRVARRHDGFGNLGQLQSRAFVELPVVGRQHVHRVAYDRTRGPALCRVGRGIVLRRGLHCLPLNVERDASSIDLTRI